MYGRHRNAGNGYRSSAAGMGIPSSRVSPEAASSSARNYARSGGGGYNSDFNRSNFNRYGPKPYQSSSLSPTAPPHPLPPPPPPPPPHLIPPKRGSELLIEAGRLAVEYLVSHGLLPSNVLTSTKSQNHIHSVDLNERHLLGLQAGGKDYSDLSIGADAAPSPDVDSRKKMLLNDYGSMSRGLESSRLGSFRSYGSDWRGQTGRDGSTSSNKPQGSSSQDMDSNGGNLSSPQDLKDDQSEFRMPDAVEILSKADGSQGLQQEDEKDHPSGADNDVDGGLQSTEDLPIKAADGVSKDSNDCTERGVIVDDELFVEENQTAEKLGEVPKDQDCQEQDSTDRNNHLNLLKLCNSAKVPTRTRSSLTNKSPIKDALLSDINASGPASQSTLSIQQYNSINELKDGSFSNLTRSSCSSGLDNHGPVPGNSVGDVGTLNSPRTLEPENYIDAQSSLEGTVSNQQGSPQALAQLGSFSSMLTDKGGKRVLVDDNATGGTKKAKEWIPSAENQDNFRVSNSGVKWAGTLKEVDSSVAKCLLLRSVAEPSVEYSEEKQMFSSSFKICDLNLLEASEVSEVHNKSIIKHTSVSAPNKEASVDVDLSISNKCSLVNNYDKFGAIGRDIELIDLEGDSLQEGECFNNSTEKLQADLTSLEGLQNRPQDLSVIAQAQDGYGLMISELIGTDMQDCSAVQLRPEMNLLHNEMSLQHGEGLLNDDDQIYMSLGEIPLSFLQVWEQPAQDYEKHF